MLHASDPGSHNRAHYENFSRDFSAYLTLDAYGFVLDYPASPAAPADCVHALGPGSFGGPCRDRTDDIHGG